MKFINIGFGNMVAVDRIVALASPDSSPIKRLISEAKDSGRVIDVSCGDAMTCLAPFAGADADNVLHYASKPYDLLIGVAETAGDPAAESAFLHDAELLLLGDTALSPLCFGGTACLLREGLSGLRFNARGNVYFDAVTSGRAVG